MDVAHWLRHWDLNDTKRLSARMTSAPRSSHADGGGPQRVGRHIGRASTKAAGGDRGIACRSWRRSNAIFPAGSASTNSSTRIRRRAAPAQRDVLRPRRLHRAVVAPRPGGSERGDPRLPVARGRDDRPFGGFIARYMGDGVLIYFGCPQAHEADAERAVRAALAVVDAIGHDSVQDERAAGSHRHRHRAGGRRRADRRRARRSSRRRSARRPTSPRGCKALAEPNAVVIDAEHAPADRRAVRLPRPRRGRR